MKTGELAAVMMGLASWYSPLYPQHATAPEVDRAQVYRPVLLTSATPVTEAGAAHDAAITTMARTGRGRDQRLLGVEVAATRTGPRRGWPPMESSRDRPKASLVGSRRLI